MDTKKNYSKQWIFKTIAVLLPFFILISVEIILHLCNYGYNTSLFTEDTTGKYYHLNPEISQKYFTVQDNATRGNVELFPKDKKPGTLRFFVLGESSTVGFPYMHNGAFSRMLKYRLQFEYPDINFEIINLSLTAVNSYTLYDFSKQLVNYQPDAVLIYAGHNEYYGALGVASSSRIGRNPDWVRATIAIKEFKTGQLILRLAARLKGTDKKTTDYTRTLMERMVLDQYIPFQSMIYQQGVRQFDKNMTDLLDLFGRHNIPVYLSNLVSNQKDQKPFISSAGKLSAFGQFMSGNNAYARKDYVSAKRHYILAKEYDELPFRAPEIFNDLINKYPSKHPNVRLVDVEAAFELHSPHGIFDSTLFLEHVHPNLFGQRLISDAFYTELRKSGILPSLKQSVPIYSVQPGEYPFTSFDSIFGRISIWLLKEQWPFNEPIPKENPLHIKTFEEQLAGACAVKQLNWFDSMRSLYDYYKQKNDLVNALYIMEGLCLEFPYEQEYYLLAGKLSFMQHKEVKALFYLNKATRLAPSQEATSLIELMKRHQLSLSLKRSQ